MPARGHLNSGSEVLCFPIAWSLGDHEKRAADSKLSNDEQGYLWAFDGILYSQRKDFLRVSIQVPLNQPVSSERGARSVFLEAN